MIFKIYLLFLFLAKAIFTLKICKDCMSPEDCERVRRLLRDTNERASLINNSTRETGDFLKICCSDFTSVDGHPNLKLLPEHCGNIDVHTGVGSFVTQYEMPWMVLISYRTLNGIQFGCVGSLISRRYVLTAAHCVKNKDIFGVRVGEYDLAKAVDCEENTNDTVNCTHENLGVSLVTYHNGYNEFGDDDIALMRLRRPANFNKRNVNAVCLPLMQGKREYKLDTEVRAISVGWGLQSIYQQSNVLMKDLVTIYSYELCSNNYTRSSNEGTRLCVGTINKKSYIGDSGGPLLIKVSLDDITTYIQYGIQQHKPTESGFSSEIYTKITKYILWILDNLKP